MSEHVPFSFEGWGLRVAHLDGEPWFALADCCRMLGIAGTTPVARQLGPKHVRNAAHVFPGSGGSNILLVSKPGLFRLILRSKRPQARRFQDWVMDTVLPTILETGKYALPPQSKSAPKGRGSVISPAALIAWLRARINVEAPASQEGNA